MSKDILSQLKKLRTEPRAGYVGEEKRVQGRDRLMAAIASSAQGAEQRVLAPVVAFEYIRFSFSDFLTKPVAALASFAILILGSLTTVSAASQSLPGDTLYSVKLVSERAQLSLATADKKAVLHTEFAGRRLQELVELSSVNEPNQELVTTTVNAFKREVASATQEIQNLQTNASDALFAQVSEVNERFSELTDSAEDTTIAPTLSEDIQEATTAASDAVVETAVGAHEQTPEPTSDRELMELFQARITRATQRRTFGIGRLSVIESHPDFSEVSSRAQTRALAAELKQVAEDISDASSIAVAGGYRRAFEMTREIETALSEIEVQLTDIETRLIEKSVEIEVPEVEELGISAPEAGDAIIIETTPSATP